MSNDGLGRRRHNIRLPHLREVALVAKQGLVNDFGGLLLHNGGLVLLVVGVVSVKILKLVQS